MILSALNDLYHRLLANPDPNNGMARVPPYGFSEQQISYCLVLSKSGALVGVEDIRDTSEKKVKPKLISVPRPEKRTSGVRANFLWDKTAYVLGVEGNKDKASVKENPWLIATKTFEAFKAFNSGVDEESGDIGLVAVQRFLASWKPDEFDSGLLGLEHVDTNVVFKLDGDLEYVHQRSAASALWSKVMSPEDASKAILGQCLVTGEHSELARLHPAIKGVWGGQSAGGSIVAFNAEAYTSFSKEQGENAPISEASAFAYTTALNYLLRRGNGQCLSIGDATAVFWARSKDARKATDAESLFGLMLNMPTDDSQEQAKLKPLLAKIALGKPLYEIAPNLEAETKFYVLGLAPNASRLSIRFWLESSFGELAENILQHFKDLMLEPSAWRDPPSIWQLLIKLAPLGKTENIPPQLAGEVLRAVITGQRYPRMLLTHVVQRIRADGDVHSLRVALIKAVLTRDHRKNFFKGEIPVTLDISVLTPAYRLGRLFAVLERIQQGALGSDVNATIADRYYGTASSVPYSVFPRLLAGSKNHLAKIRKDKPGYAFVLEKDLANVIDGLETSFPKHFSIEQQGQFAIGYYHQKQSNFVKKEVTVPAEDSANTLSDPIQ
jgi:CRISPR-associated protein Csd1